VTLAFDDGRPAYTLTREGSGAAGELVVPDPSVGRPHARLLTAAGRIGLEDLGTPGGTFIDGARLLPSHGPRDITAVRAIRLGNVELALSRT
jgi:pSer/pThr/pTyr-binding forkhead associated (FHA) protein